MSTFAVRVEEINEVKPHPNADRLELASLNGLSFQFVVPKDAYKPGDRVIYFPVDSVLPENVIAKMGLTGKLSGGAKNRVKTIKLRGAISQGLVAPLKEFDIDPSTPIGADFTEALSVVKWELEPDIVGNKPDYLAAMPEFVRVYDIEGCERNPEIIEKYLLDQPVVVTEKVEGSHFSISLKNSSEYTICQRRYAIKESPELQHTWISAARDCGLYDLMPQLYNYFIGDHSKSPVGVVTVRGELIGPKVQGNIYNLTKHEIRVFEIEVNGMSLSASDYLDAIHRFQLLHAPVYARDITLRQWLEMIGCETVAEASNGKSVINPEVLREGIVIRPTTERYDEKLGRVILKQRSPEYLANSEL